MSLSPDIFWFLDFSKSECGRIVVATARCLVEY